MGQAEGTVSLLHSAAEEEPALPLSVVWQTGKIFGFII